MKIFGSKRTNSQPGELYATRADFCRVFDNDRDRLYLLSLLLTGDPELAEKCFVRGLEDSKGGNPVFKEWARSWARRTIITNAIRMVGPRPGVSQPVPQDVNGLSAELAAVLGL